MIRIGLIGDYDVNVVAHRAIPIALALAADDLGVQVETDWIPTESLDGADAHDRLAGYSAIWCVPASPYRSMQGALNGIRYAREQRIPFLGTCGGFQHMMIEFARNVAHLHGADHAEINSGADVLLVTPLSCSVSERTHTFTLKPGSRVLAIYEAGTITEQYGICNYGLNAEYASILEANGLHTTGYDANGVARMMELEGHPFYVGALFQPERSALKNVVHPLIRAYVQAAWQ
ncbi:CTP synthase (UTP-ammonia lyase) [Paenibacillus phyllosphaerae]|uniref:CTP synthase (glutamine hydrolyzing) n=1 Tax=Paenibacillus phyllosphaerae TaxID=274593 RepID=A0A7W5AWP6_9BACL|nr:hypothetical protein [Paenibacillus phyllosphaerae]MBB3110195.1 CTP synthase (UTP-ammonia lyase) [Paenibacillus phyllosphaerae]